MNFLDMRTILFGYVLTDIVCLGVAVLLWRQSRERFAGMSFWVWDFALQTLALLLITLRGSIPDWISITGAQALVMTSAYLGYLGLLKFAGRKAPQVHNYGFIVLLTLVNFYFAFIQPNLTFRNLNVAVGLLIFCSQCAWLALRAAPTGMRELMRGVGFVFVGLCIVNIIRIVDNLAVYQIKQDFFQLRMFDKLIVISYQMLFILLTYALALMANKRLHRDIAAQEEKYSKAFLASPHAINLIRLSDGVLIEANRGFLNTTGYSHSEVIGKTAAELNLWADDQKRILMVRELMELGAVRDREYSFLKKSGEILTGLLSADIITINNEACVLSSVTDITLRKRMEEALQKSEYRFRTTLDNMLEGCQMIDTGWRFVYINEAAARHGRLPKDSYIGQRQTDLFPGIERTSLFELERRCMLEGVSSRTENEFPYPDGSTGWFDISIYPVPEGIFILSVDISDRKSAQEALLQSESFLNNILEQSPTSLWIADVQGTFLRCNPACLKLFSLKAEEVVGRYNIFEDAILKEQGLMPQVVRAFQKGETVRFESAYDTSRLADLHLERTVKVILEVTLFPVKNARGRVTNVVIQHEEITARKQAQEEIRQLNLALEQKVAERTKELRDSQAALLNLVDDLNESSQSLTTANQTLEAVNKEMAAFSYSVSHDLRAPLRSIDGFGRALAEDYGDKLTGDALDYLQRIRRATQTMGQLIDDMLNLSRITQAQLHCREVNLSRLAQNILEGFQSFNPSRSVDIRIQEDIMVYADDHLMNIALTNLLENAWKFTAKTSPAVIEFGSEIIDGQKAVFIRDNGAGFEPQYAGRLFAAFQRLHKAEDYPGTGIGLATVQRIIHRHNGKIWAEGEVGHGAVFYFTLGE